MKLKQIADILGMDPTSISKEIKRNRTATNSEIGMICDKTQRYPYVCNNCSKKYKRCGYRKYDYNPIKADSRAIYQLKEKRRGLDISEEDFAILDELIKQGIEDKRSVYDIVHSSEEIKVSVPTVYRYINNRYLSVKRHELPYATTYKKRKKINKKYDYKENTKFSRNNRTFLDYLDFKRNNPGLFGAQMDFLGAIKTDSNNILTLTIPDIHFVLLFKCKKYSYMDVQIVFNKLEEKIGIEDFKRIFPYILTDRDPLFSNFEALEYSHLTGEERTHIFYCDAFNSSQKGNVENMNKQLRLFFPKKGSVDNIPKDYIRQINHELNTRKLASLSGNSAEEAFIRIYGEATYNKLFD